jgi:hypothetical protein
MRIKVDSKDKPTEGWVWPEEDKIFPWEVSPFYELMEFTSGRNKGRPFMLWGKSVVFLDEKNSWNPSSAYAGETFKLSDKKITITGENYVD